MARNYAVIVGINDYDEISPLKYAKSDAEKMRDFFMQDLSVSNNDLYFFTDDSPRNGQGRKTQPTYGTLKSFLGDRFANPFLSTGDTLWFYFSGHGMPCEGRDYLLPSDGNPRSIPDLAIPIGDVTERLRRSGADNVVMLIDACRSDGAKNAGMGIGEEKQQGVITFFSCSPSQVSYEIDEIGQGAFTNVLLEALRIQGEGNCATVERFANYLKARVPQLTKRFKNYAQTPYVEIKPETKLHYILLPKFANLTDIALLREDALHAEIEGNFALAFQLWMRVNVASGGTDIKAINALIRIGNKQFAPNLKLKERISSEGNKSSSVPPVSPPSVPNEFKRESIGKSSSEPIVVESPTNKIDRSPQRGEDLRFDLRLSFREALFGREGEIKILHLERCDTCKGEGVENNILKSPPCKTCNGTSLVSIVKKLRITIPAGVDAGTRLRVATEGDAGAYCGETGDLYVYLFVESDDKFKRDGMNIRSTIEIKQSQALSGCQLNIDTIDGSILLTIPPKTKSGKVLRLRGRGVPKLGNPIERGDHLVTVNIQSVTSIPIPTEQVDKNSVELVSAKGINYSELKELLKAQEWRKADELTASLMCQAANRKSQGWLDEDSTKAFPYEDLRTIDQLWMYYSNNKFGFTIQKIMWLKCGGKIGKQDYETWCKFAMQVGWYKSPKFFWSNEIWKTYTEFMSETTNALNAPTASLPSISTQFLAWTKDSIVIGWVGLSILSRGDL